METSCFYWNHHQHGPILGIGQRAYLKYDQAHELIPSEIDSFFKENKGAYIFGYLSYEVKNHLENLKSNNSDLLNFPTLHFWIPQSIYKLDEQTSLFWGDSSETNFKIAKNIHHEILNANASIAANFEARTSKDEYFNHFSQLKKSLQLGEIYEVNYCQELYVSAYSIDRPYALFGRLNTCTKAPHAAFIQTKDHYVFCASPERFIQKKANTLLSQPIKGTAPRNTNREKDRQNAQNLKNNPKERAENIMIVDLVRNDLSRIAQKNSVKVEELCEIYSFESVHQMISSISCKLDEDRTFWEIIGALFPMGSMTGAPKLASMELIEAHEDFKRGLYSGSIGLFDPNGDFDFNVVIRSLLYNRQNNYLSCSVGSAITINANAEDEFNECMLKAQKLTHGLK